MTDCLIASPDAERLVAALAPLNLPESLALNVANKPEQVAHYIERAEIILGQPAWLAPYLSRAHNLKWLQSTFAGVEPLMGAEARRDYLLTGVKGIFGSLMREYVFGKLLEIYRHFPRYRAQQNLRRWQPHPYAGLSGRTLAVVGLGSIGLEIARTGRHFGMRVLGFNRSGQCFRELDACYSLASVTSAGKNARDSLQFFPNKAAVTEDPLGTVDVIVFALPGTPELTHAIDEKVLRRLKPGAVLFNVGRGNLLAQGALLDALASGQLAAAVLDVFEQEPLPSSHPFWNTPNLHVTPHISAQTFAEDMAPIFVENYLRYTQGRPLLHQVDFSKGY